MIYHYTILEYPLLFVFDSCYLYDIKRNILCDFKEPERCPSVRLSVSLSTLVPGDIWLYGRFVLYPPNDIFLHLPMERPLYKSANANLGKLPFLVCDVMARKYLSYGQPCISNRKLIAVSLLDVCVIIFPYYFIFICDLFVERKIAGNAFGLIFWILAAVLQYTDFLYV